MMNLLKNNWFWVEAEGVLSLQPTLLCKWSDQESPGWQLRERNATAIIWDERVEGVLLFADDAVLMRDSANESQALAEQFCLRESPK